MRKFRAIIEFETTERNFNEELESVLDEIQNGEKSISVKAYKLTNALDDVAIDVTNIEIVDLEEKETK